MKTLEDIMNFIYTDYTIALTNKQKDFLGLPHDLPAGWFKKIKDKEFTDEETDAFILMCTKGKLKELGIEPPPTGKKKKGKGKKDPLQKKVDRLERTDRRIVLKLDEVLQETHYKKLIRAASKFTNYSYIISKEFLQSTEWAALRYLALTAYGKKCSCCGRTPEDGAILNVDHIKPRRLFPELALSLENLQILCSACNRGKGSSDMTDHR